MAQILAELRVGSPNPAPGFGCLPEFGDALIDSGGAQENGANRPKWEEKQGKT